MTMHRRIIHKINIQFTYTQYSGNSFVHASVHIHVQFSLIHTVYVHTHIHTYKISVWSFNEMQHYCIPSDDTFPVGPSRPC